MKKYTPQQKFMNSKSSTNKQNTHFKIQIKHEGQLLYDICISCTCDFKGSYLLSHLKLVWIYMGTCLPSRSIYWKEVDVVIDHLQVRRGCVFKRRQFYFYENAVQQLEAINLTKNTEISIISIHKGFYLKNLIQINYSENWTSSQK